MTFSKAINTTEIADTDEEPFSIEEVFYSRTDKRGVIRSGNAVFQRVSGFEWDRLIGAPHRIVRHQDTPKALFWLMWQAIQQGKPIGAYVKNKSARGLWYWVFAVVVPSEDGYYSVRIKPSSQIFAQIQPIYAEIVELEQTQSISPDRSSDILLAKLQEIGFASYSEFMSGALDQELTARGTALGRPNRSQSRLLTAITANLKATQEKQSALMLEFDELQSIPTNMRIIASRLEPSGGPISAISDNYKFASTEISRRLEAFAGNENNLCTSMSTLVAEALFLTSATPLLVEVPELFAKEDHSHSPIEVDKELEFLSAVAGGYRDELRRAVTKAEQVSGELNLASGEIRRMMLGLDTIRVMGRVESGRLGASGVGLSSTIDQLDMRHAAIAEHLQGLMDLSAAVRSAISAYERQTTVD
jgi:hypothetical protein